MSRDSFTDVSVLKDVGRNVRRARIRRNLTSSNLADIAGISRPSLRAVEQGQPGVSLGTLYRVLKALGLEQDLAGLASDDSHGQGVRDAEIDKVRRVRPRANLKNLDHLIEEEWLDWYRMSPADRWKQSEELFAHFLSIGGSLDPEPDSQSPFFDEEEWRKTSSNGRPGLRVVRRGGV